MNKKNRDFDFSPDEYWDASDLSGCFRCETCFTHIPRNMNTEKIISIKEAKDNSPSWIFYKNYVFCSVACEERYLKAPFNQPLLPLDI